MKVTNEMSPERIKEHLDTFISMLNERLIDFKYMDGLDSISIADIMWFAAIRHIVSTHNSFVSADDYEHFNLWWVNMYEEISLDLCEESDDEPEKEK